METSFGRKQCLPYPSCPQLRSISARRSTPGRLRALRLSRLAARAQQGSSQVVVATATVVAKPAKSEKQKSTGGPPITPEVAEDLYRCSGSLRCCIAEPASVEAASPLLKSPIASETWVCFFAHRDMFLGREFEEMCAQMYYRGKMFGASPLASSRACLGWRAYWEQWHSQISSWPYLLQLLQSKHVATNCSLPVSHLGAWHVVEVFCRCESDQHP